MPQPIKQTTVTNTQPQEPEQTTEITNTHHRDEDNKDYSTENDNPIDLNQGLNNQHIHHQENTTDSEDNANGADYSTDEDNNDETTNYDDTSDIDIHSNSTTDDHEEHNTDHKNHHGDENGRMDEENDSDIDMTQAARNRNQPQTTEIRLESTPSWIYSDTTLKEQLLGVDKNSEQSHISVTIHPNFMFPTKTNSASRLTNCNSPYNENKVTRHLDTKQKTNPYK
jgi:hypothetical protein